MHRPGDLRDPPAGACPQQRDQMPTGPVARQVSRRDAVETMRNGGLQAVDDPKPNETRPVSYDLDPPIAHGHAAHAEPSTQVRSQSRDVAAQHRTAGHEHGGKLACASGLPRLLTSQVEAKEHTPPPARGGARRSGWRRHIVGCFGGGGRPGAVASRLGRPSLPRADQSDGNSRDEYQEHTHDHQHAAPRPERRGLRAAVGGHPGRHQPTLPQFGSVACGLSTDLVRGSVRYLAAWSVPWPGRPMTLRTPR